MPTIAQLFQQTPIRVEQGASMLCGCYYNHIPEIEEYDLSGNIWKDGFANLIEQVVFHEAICDPRRSWIMFGVRYNGNWVMLCSNAGRELDDYHKKQIVDDKAYVEMIDYIRKEVARVSDIDKPETVPLDTEVEFYFYGHDVRQTYYSY